MTPELGILEGYYGRPWTWAERAEQVSFLAPHGYGFFIYGPKADSYLRRRWREDHPQAEADEIKRLADHCAALGVRFGVGLSPFEIYLDFNAEARDALARKLTFLDVVGVEYLGIFFDDMRGDLEGLAATQVRILHWIAERTKAKRIIACPTYYTDDPMLRRFSGAEPPNYLQDLGAGLDGAIDLFWTGEEVCSKEFSPGHLQRVGEQMRRRPFLWDNYPVNDGPTMSPFLHLRAFTGRPASISPHVAAHAVNPALQPVLSRIPALTLAESYARGEAYEYAAAFQHAATAVLGEALARTVHGHLYSFQELGLDRLGEGLGKLRVRYSAIDHPGAREITAFLDGAYRITREALEAS